ncbi:MAG: M10 family metallopeptidase C-terminal domain-containing protein, partial [Paracoccaceae bacterium]
MATGIPTDGTPTDGANPWIDSLVWGGKWADADGGTTTIGVALMSGADPYAIVGFGYTWLNYEISAITSALAAFEAVANIEFSTVASADADIWYWSVDDIELGAGVLGIHEVPNFAYEPLYAQFNWEGSGWDSSGLQIGGYGFLTLVHEMGHGLGLAHPHDGGSLVDATNFPGVVTSSDLGTHRLNQGIHTVMTYNDPWVTGVGSPPSYDYGWVGGPMALDIYALQLLYGPNNNFQTGNNTYLLPKTNAAGTYWSSIWDAGGIDTISNAGSSLSANIDLREAPLVGPDAGGYISSAQGIHGGFTVAFGAEIENAVGGSGNDTLTGNDLGNSLVGDAGTDILIGNGGNDTLNGGDGDDTVAGNNGRDKAFLGAGNDLFQNNGQGGTLGRDTVFGGAGDDTVQGGNGDDAFHGGGGADRMLGRLGDDLLAGGAGNDTLNGGDGNDTLSGG